MKRLRHLLLCCLIIFAANSMAHPLPGSTVALSVADKSVSGEAKMPLIELEAALGMEPDTTLSINTEQFRQYFLAHIKAATGNNPWTTSITTMEVITTNDELFGNYQQAVVHFKLAAPNGIDTRSFMLQYDVILHRVITHEALVYLKEDWLNGVHHDNEGAPIGTIKMDFKKGTINQLPVTLDKGSWLTGFTNTVTMGMQHIKEGTDHLLFLFVLLLPATLLYSQRQWTGFSGTKQGVKKLVKIITAFTIGHSVTLLLGAFGLVMLPGKFVETMIAISIFVSAVHAYHPLFPGKEFYVAGGFGLIHGLAFASVLSGMGLSVPAMALSILGFNIGIEMMQLFIVALVVPWLMVLSRLPQYKYFRQCAAIAAGVASIGWMLERISGHENNITKVINSSMAFIN